MEKDKPNFKIAYVITNRNGRNFWNRVGVAFVNSDGSINVRLEAVPVNGEIQIRDYTPRDELGALPLRSGNGANETTDSFAELG